MEATEVASFWTNFFKIVGTLEAETLMGGEAECLLAIGEDNKCKLFGVTSLRSVTFKKWRAS